MRPHWAGTTRVGILPGSRAIPLGDRRRRVRATNRLPVVRLARPVGAVPPKVAKRHLSRVIVKAAATAVVRTHSWRQRPLRPRLLAQLLVNFPFLPALIATPVYTFRGFLERTAVTDADGGGDPDPTVLAPLFLVLLAQLKSRKGDALAAILFVYLVTHGEIRRVQIVVVVVSRSIRCRRPTRGFVSQDLSWGWVVVSVLESWQICRGRIFGLTKLQRNPLISDMSLLA